MLQHSTPVGLIVSHAPPAEFTADALKVKLVPVLVTANTCGVGFEPPSVIAKFSAPVWLNTFGPINTLTGMLTLPLDALNNTWPV